MQHSSEPDELIAVGKIAKAVGLEGFCAVEPYGFTLESIKLPCVVIIGYKIEDSENVLLEEIDIKPKKLLCRFENRHDRDSAEQLHGKTIYVSRNLLPSLENDEFYHFELIGMKVFTDQNKMPIGSVIEVHNFPSADTLEIKRFNGETLLIPLVNESVVSIDKQARQIVFMHSFIEELL